MNNIFTTCIVCPLGCNLRIEEEDGIISVSGNTCPRGKTYGEQEFRSPMRVVTSLIKLDNGAVLPVKTTGNIPKNKIFEVLNKINRFKPNLPISIGDVLIKNILNLNVDIVATGDYSI